MTDRLHSICTGGGVALRTPTHERKSAKVFSIIEYFFLMQQAE